MNHGRKEMDSVFFNPQFGSENIFFLKDDSFTETLHEHGKDLHTVRNLAVGDRVGIWTC